MINNEIYGSSDNWVNIDYSVVEGLTPFKMAYFGDSASFNDSTLYSAQDLGNLQNGELIDASITFAAVDSDCEFAKITTFSKHTTHLDVEPVNKHTDITPDITPVFWWYGLASVEYNYGYRPSYKRVFDNYHGDTYSSAGNAGQRNWGTSERAIHEFSSYNQGNSIDYVVAPITDYSYKNLVFVPVVYCANNDYTWYTYFDLITYVTSRYNDYPHVISLLALPFTPRTQSGEHIRYGYWYSLGIGYNRVMQMCSSTPPETGEEDLTQFIQYNLNGYDDDQISIPLNDYGDYLYTGYGITLGGIADNDIMQRAPEWDYNDPDNPISEYDYNLQRYFGTQFELTYISVEEAPFKRYFTKYFLDITDGTVDAFKSYALTQCAYLGHIFCIDLNYVLNDLYESDYTDSRVYFGLTGDDGINHGDYTQGADNVNTAQYNWTNIFDDNTNYDPYNPSGDKSDTMDINTPVVSALSTFNNAYALNKYESDLFSQYLWFNGGEHWYDTFLNHFKLVENGIECVVSLKCYPFDVVSAMNITAEDVTIVIGNTDTSDYSLTAAPLDDMHCLLDMGTIDISFDDNFTSYEPYTTAELYIPYCNRVEIPISEFNHKQLSVKMIVDLATGGCNAMVYNGGSLYATSSGTIGIDINVTARANADYSKQVTNGITQATSSALMLANPNTAPFGILGLAEGVKDVAIDKPRIHTHGNITSTIGFSMPQYCYLIVKRAKLIDSDNYAHNVGYACNVSGVVSDFAGFTQFANVDTAGINATENEKQEIKSLLESGVYV